MHLRETVSFSDGRFFVYRTYGRGTHLCTESPTGYVLHRKLPSSIGIQLQIGNISPLLSPSGESIIAPKCSEIRPSRTTDPITSIPIVPIQPSDPTDFILEFPLDRSPAAAVRLRDNAVIIIDLKSGDRWLITDARVNTNTVIVVGEGEVITLDLPTGDCFSMPGRMLTTASGPKCSIVQHRVPNGHTPHQSPPISTTLPPPGDQTKA